jgi:benzoyl-CoA reductase/2-hydroxyglutaryl-CoA dehydratase subunit BcrC/BadD/HgdB
MYGRALMERALEGGFNFLDAQLATETCTVTCRFQEHMQMMPGLINNPNFFCEFTDVPFKKNDNSILHYKDQLQAHVLDVLHEKLGVDTSDEAIRKAIEEQNEINRVIREIGEFRKLDNPTITGFEFALCQLVAIACPHYLILPKLKETLEDLKTRKPDPKPGYRIKVVVAGSENDDPYFIQLIEECGARVVADRYCYGSIPGREEIEIKEGETALEAVARHYLQTSMCTRFMEQHVMRQRKETLAGIVKEYKADGIIIEQMKFCEYWSYERMIDTFVLRRDYGIPVCSIEKEYNNGATGQLRTRFQAFIESVELKKLQSEKAERGVG